MEAAPGDRYEAHVTIRGDDAEPGLLEGQRYSSSAVMPFLVHQGIQTLIVYDTVATATLAGQGLLSIRSNHDVDTTVDRLEAAIKAKGFGVFGKVPHHKGAAKVGMKLRPTTLLIFGNPKVGAPLMQCSRTTGIDLPQKALIWQDQEGTTWLSYNDPQYLKTRHNIEGCDPVLGKVSQALSNFANAATAE